MSLPQSIGDFFKPDMMPPPVRLITGLAALTVLVSTIALACLGSISFGAAAVIAAFTAVVMTGSGLGSIGITALGFIGLVGISLAASASAGVYYPVVYYY